ncbi:MAG: HNH endonuclease [Promethearchaeota archaeon]
MTKGSAKTRLLAHFKNNIGTKIPNSELEKIANVSDWPRVCRTLRQEGWLLEHVQEGSSHYYILHSDIKEKGNKRVNISSKLRYEILRRDGHRCVQCGKSSKEDDVKLEIDHKIPVNMGGLTEESNLQTLCQECNHGKKAYFDEFKDDERVIEVLKQNSGLGRLRKIGELFKGEGLTPNFLGTLTGIRDWTRSLRRLRENHELDYDWDSKKEVYLFK